MGVLERGNGRKSTTGPTLRVLTPARGYVVGSWRLTTLGRYALLYELNRRVIVDACF